MSKKSFEINNIQIWGKKGKDWLEELPSIVDALARQWSLSELKLVKNLSYNYVATGYQGSNSIALKIGCDQYEIQKEIEVLKAYDGNGCIKLLNYNLEYNAMLLEQAIPGSSLISLFPTGDDMAVDCAINIMRSLHAAPIPNTVTISSVRNWLTDLFEPPQASNMYHIYKAQSIAERLLATQTVNNVLLHGDLHHGNMLLSERGWLAIDPKGVIGEPAFEICAFIRNPYPEQLKSKELIAHRVELFCNRMEIDKQRLQAWLYVRAVLDACWLMQDGEFDSNTIFAQAQLVEIK